MSFLVQVNAFYRVTVLINLLWVIFFIKNFFLCSHYVDGNIYLIVTRQIVSFMKEKRFKNIIPQVKVCAFHLVALYICSCYDKDHSSFHRNYRLQSNSPHNNS
jgi:hypothetical protein